MILPGILLVVVPLLFVRSYASLTLMAYNFTVDPPIPWVYNIYSHTLQVNWNHHCAVLMT